MTQSTSAEALVPALRLQGVGRRFGALQALRDVTMEVAVGERRAILGPNGAGKTTLFNVVTGDYLPTSGRVELYGADVTSLPPHRRTRLGLSRTYQNSMLFMGLTVGQSLFLAIRGVQRGRFDPRRPSATDPGRVRSEEIASLVHLSDVLKTAVGSLAHGQQRQLELGMAIAASPRLLMLDEPAAGLSPGERTLLSQLLKDLPREITVILVEHDMDVALAAADRVSVMHEGTVIVEGTPDEIQVNSMVQDIYLGHRVTGDHRG
ncbi:MAG: ABC transporter ATP-binding protein [Chloroflexi bacterium]|nr:ABC transporter ATP-binding protein [Chloroflexota bacterium]